jgi:hypothetical protein
MIVDLRTKDSIQTRVWVDLLTQANPKANLTPYKEQKKRNRSNQNNTLLSAIKFSNRN